VPDLIAVLKLLKKAQVIIAKLTTPSAIRNDKRKKRKNSAIMVFQVFEES